MIYDAMNLWLEREELKDSEAYMKISISHRTLLLRVNSVNDKRKLAEKFYSENFHLRKQKNLSNLPPLVIHHIAMLSGLLFILNGLNPQNIVTKLMRVN